MKSNLNKKILVSAELASSETGAFFQDLGFELHQSYDSKNEYEFIIDAACLEVKTLPRLQISDVLDSSLRPLVRSRISKEMFSSVQGKKLLSSYFKDAQEFDLVDRYSKEMKDIYTVKIHDYLNVGFFIDSIVIEAYKAKFNIDGLRSYLNTALSFAFKKVEKSRESMPIDISYSHNGEAFTVQISMIIDHFKGQAELGDHFDNMIAEANYFDSTYFHKKNKLTLSTLFFKEESLKSAKAYFFTEIAKRSNDMDQETAQLHSGLVQKENVSYEVVKKTAEEENARFTLARKFALFIRNFRKNEESPIPVAKLELNDVINYLGHYPRQEALRDVDGEVKEFIFKLLKDDDLFNGIDNQIQKIAGTNLDSQVQEIQKVLGGKSLNDIEDIMVIKGGQTEKTENTIVKGWMENLPESQKVSGPDNQPLSDNQIWEVRKLQLNVKIQDEVARVNSEGRNIVQDDIVRVMAKELDAKEQDVKFVVGGIVEEVVSNEMLNAKRLEEEFAQKVLNLQPAVDQVKEKLESQVSRMKKIIDHLKKDMMKLQAEKTERDELDRAPTESDQTNIELAKMKVALSRTLEALKGKERIMEKIKSDADNALKHKDLKIDFLEQKIEEVKNEFTRSREFANEERLEKLESENKTLLARLELANKKVNIISENLENKETALLEKREKEIDNLKATMQISQSLVEDLKQEKIKLEAHLSAERDTVRKLKEEKGGKGQDEEKDGMIQVLSADRKALEDKLKLQSMELKKTEQKLKYTLSQLDASNKKKPSGAKSSEAYAKQLDQANARMAESTAEVTEKRREILKLKQENQVMSSKITELEKKLANLDKKVA